MTRANLLALSGLMLIVSGSTMAASPAPACKVESGTTKTPLIELYSSEGCDSCPPADRWLATNFAPQAPAANAIALAFHVDYWDRLGWKDRFATPEFTARQYAAMRANGATFVYTPQVLLQGRDFPSWHNADAGVLIRRAATMPALAQIVLTANPSDTGIVVSASTNVPDAAAHHAQLFVAYTDSGLSSQVTAGENRGVRLSHDHVVRTLRAGSPIKSAGALQSEFTFAYPKERGSAPQLVAFVQDTASGEILQALALPLAACAKP
jgi:hypothetical protein